MIDKPTLDKINLLHPKIREEVKVLVEKANTLIAHNITIRIVQGLRTIDEQNGLYALGRTKVNPDGKSAKKPLGNIVTNARGGSSYHNFGFAIDFCFLVDGKVISWDVKKDWDNDKTADWLEVVKVFTIAGYEWGGNWKTMVDMPHFQKTFGVNWREMLRKYNAGDFIPGTKYIRI